MTPSERAAVTVVFLGGGNRVQTAKLLHLASARLGLDSNLIAVELISDRNAPIADIASVVVGPRFESLEFSHFLDSLVQEQPKAILVPFMDSAAVALASWASLSDYSAAVVSGDAECLANKLTLKKVAGVLGLPVVPDTEGFFPKAVKHVMGFGGRTVHFAKDYDDLAGIVSKGGELVIEDWIVGSESTVDVYFERTGDQVHLIGRDRLRVEGGEVVHTRTRDASPTEVDVIMKLSRHLSMSGPVNFQFLHDANGTYLMECNPRFSGGSTASIAAGWDAWSWIFQEYALAVSPKMVEIKHVEVLRSRRDHVREV